MPAVPNSPIVNPTLQRVRGASGNAEQSIVLVNRFAYLFMDCPNRFSYSSVLQHRSPFEFHTTFEVDPYVKSGVAAPSTGHATVKKVAFHAVPNKALDLGKEKLKLLGRTEQSPGQAKTPQHHGWEVPRCQDPPGTAEKSSGTGQNMDACKHH